MRGNENQQGGMFSYVSMEKRVPQDHPLRAIRQLVDQILAWDNELFRRDLGPLPEAVDPAGVPYEMDRLNAYLRAHAAAQCHGPFGTIARPPQPLGKYRDVFEVELRGRRLRGARDLAGGAQVLGGVDAHAAGALHQGLDDDAGDFARVRLERRRDFVETLSANRGVSSAGDEQ